MQFLLAVALVVFLPVTVHAEPSQQEAPPHSFPHGCVDCHVQLPDRDVRLSTLMEQWSREVPAPLLEKARAVAPGMKLTGRHPAVTVADGNVPGSCLSCHGTAGVSAPPFGRLLHAIHLSGGEANHFIALFGGKCTHCHTTTDQGEVTVANGVERR